MTIHFVADSGERNGSRRWCGKIMANVESPVVSLSRRAGNPIILLGLLYLLCVIFNNPFTSYHLVLAIVVYFVSTVVQKQFSALEFGRDRGAFMYLRDLICTWAITDLVVLILVLFGELREKMDGQLLVAWMILTPVSVFVWQRSIGYVAAKSGDKRSRPSVVIVGVNELTVQVAKAFSERAKFDMQMHGFFEDRNSERHPCPLTHPVLGNLGDISRYVTENNIKMIFIGAPINGHPRVARLSRDLQDTTASVYYVPDISNFQLTQPRLQRVGGVSVIAVCETPFVGINLFIKRWSDIILSAAALCLFLPLMAAIAFAIMVTSPGPVIFRQRRYGLHGETIIVYKFRSMTVTDDGPVMLQARQNDERMTPIGAFLRKTSLDELPQFVNVLQGRMSIVGPRPHAVAHNEHYRKLIKGYMLRHKIKPGITGWAQVHGFRGETSSIDKMEARIGYDLEYLRDWSLWLDLWIIAKTISVVFKHQNAH
jgi:putative colanic acid biosynthesis UDP-glucose lipid carrier transferase